MALQYCKIKLVCSRPRKRHSYIAETISHVPLNIVINEACRLFNEVPLHSRPTPKVPLFCWNGVGWALVTLLLSSQNEHSVDEFKYFSMFTFWKIHCPRTLMSSLFVKSFEVYLPMLVKQLVFFMVSSCSRGSSKSSHQCADVLYQNM